MPKSLSTARQGPPRAEGPIWVGQVITVDVDDPEGGPAYRIQWLPDANNEALREAGEAMCFYYLPNEPRLVRDRDGHFKFHLQKFSGVMDPSRNIGEEGYAELAGGLLSFTTTLDYPEDVLVRAFEKLKEQLPGHRESRFFFWRSGDAEPVRRGPVALHENELVMHQLSPDEAEGGGAAGPEHWAFEIQGAEEGGSLNVQGSNSFTVMLGSRPVQMLHASAESGTSQVTVESRFSYYVRSMVTEIKVVGSWDSVYHHLSTHLRGGIGVFRPLDLQAAVDDMVQQDAVHVEINYGEGLVEPSDRQQYEEVAATIAESFRTRIASRLEAALSAQEGGAKSGASAEEPEEDKPPSGGGLVGAFRRLFWVPKPRLSLALEASRSRFTGEMNETWTINQQLLRHDVVASQMQGVFDEMQQDASARDRYFSEIFFEEGFQKIHVVARANAHWGGDGEAGDPIHTVNLQVGYPDSRGNLQWKSVARYKDSETETAFPDEPSVVSWTPETRDRLYAFDFTRHEGPGETVRLKNIIRFRESPDVAVDEVVLEEETDSHVVEVRASAAGNLRVGPIGLDMPIEEGDEQIQVVVRVRTRTFGERAYEFNGSTIGERKLYSVWYARPEDIESHEHKVEVAVRGRRFGQPALRWEGDWVRTTGSGPLLVAIPPVPEDLEAKVDEYLVPAA